MKKLIIALSLFSFVNFAHANETTPESAATTVKAETTMEVKPEKKRIVKHKFHKGEEGLCRPNDKTCIALMAKEKAAKEKTIAAPANIETPQETQATEDYIKNKLEETKETPAPANDVNNITPNY